MKKMLAICVLVAVLLTGCSEVVNEVLTGNPEGIVEETMEDSSVKSPLGINPLTGGLTINNIDMTTGQYAPLSIGF